MTKHNTHDHKHDQHDHKDHKNHSMAQPTNNNMFMGVIIALLLVIAIMGFFLGRMTVAPAGQVIGGGANYEEVSITVITDERDSSVNATDILNEIKNLPSIASAKVIEKTFADAGVKELLEENNITNLPVFIFSTNNFDTSSDPIQQGQNGQPGSKINGYLQKLPKEGYFLPIGATFNPFVTRSARGKLQLADGVLDDVLAGSYIDGNKDAKIIWLEYSDMECPYCGKLHNDGAIEQVKEKFGTDVAMVYNHFPLNFHPNAQKAAEALECIAKENGGDTMYKQIKDSYAKYFNNNFTFDGFYELAEANGINVASIKSCVDAGTFSQKVKDQQEFGAKNFGVTGTPGNVLINTETGEYEVVSGAVPFAQLDIKIGELK